MGGWLVGVTSRRLCRVIPAGWQRKADLSICSRGGSVAAFVGLTSGSAMCVGLPVGEGHLRQGADGRQHCFVLAVTISEAALERLLLLADADGLLSLGLLRLLRLLLHLSTIFLQLLVDEQALAVEDALDCAGLGKHVVCAAQEGEDREVRVAEGARLDAVAAEDDDVVADQVCRVSHPRLKRLPHLLVVERLLDLDSGLDLLPLLQNDVIDPDIRERLRLLVLFAAV